MEEEKLRGKVWEEWVVVGYMIDLGNYICVDVDVVVMGLVRFRYEFGVYYDVCECCLFLVDLIEVVKR